MPPYAEPKSKTWSWDFDCPPAIVWAALADTQSLNEAIGAPKYTIEETPRADGSVMAIAHAKMGPCHLEWEEKPVDRVVNRWFQQHRVFRKGPSAIIDSWLEITPLDPATAQSSPLRRRRPGSSEN